MCKEKMEWDGTEVRDKDNDIWIDMRVGGWLVLYVHAIRRRRGSVRTTSRERERHYGMDQHH